MVTENPNDTSPIADSDSVVVVVDGFAIHKRDWFSLQDIFLDWGYQRQQWWKTARQVIEIDENDPDRRVQEFRCPFKMRRKINSLHPSIGRLEGLDSLSLIHTRRLRSLPEEIRKLQNLTKLFLFESGITGFPPALCRLQNLKELDLGWSYSLTTLPKEIGQLKNLVFLNLWGSGVKSLPPSIGKLQNLQELHLFNSRLECLPPSIGQLQNLKILDLQDTKKLIVLPKEIGNLGNLIELNLEGSGVICFPASIQYDLACSRYRPRLTAIVTNSMVNLWPNILGNAKYAFVAKGRLRNNLVPLEGLEPHDAIYRILVDYRESSFMTMLINRNKF